MFALLDAALTRSLNTLSMLLHKHYGRKAIILIDEYDVPLAKADAQGYYGEMIGLIRNMFDAALKSNASLEFAVMTGCLRVSKESMPTAWAGRTLERSSRSCLQDLFTGLNNLKMYTLLDARCDEQFGFTDSEVRHMLEYYGLMEYYELTKTWYDGYMVGDMNVYNPWDVINWCDQLLTTPNKAPKSYRTNTSSNTELRKFIHKMGDGTGIIIEVKYAKDGRFDAAIDEAMRQIDEKGYTERFEDDDMGKILKVAFACHKRQCRAAVECEKN